MKEIQEHLRKTYAGKLGEAYEWLVWARCLEYGPLFFEKPTPFQLIDDPEDPAFVVSLVCLFCWFVELTCANALSVPEWPIEVPFPPFSGPDCIGRN